MRSSERPVTAGQPLSRSVYAAKLGKFADVALADQSAFAHREKWSAFFAERIGSGFSGRLIIEIGCFDASYLSDIAAAYPETAFVGIDWKCKAIYDGAKRISSHGLNNVVLLRARGQDLAKIFAQAEADEIWIFHPDPCDRPEERKNRLVNESFLLQAHAILKDSVSTLTLKTDHEEYYRSVMAQFATPYAASRSIPSRFQIAMNSADFWNDKAAISYTEGRCFSQRATLFEKRFIRKHAPIFFIEIRNNPDRLQSITLSNKKQ